MLSPPILRGNRCSIVNDDSIGWYTLLDGGLAIVIILSQVGHFLPISLLNSSLRDFEIWLLFDSLPDLMKEMDAS